MNKPSGKKGPAKQNVDTGDEELQKKIKENELRAEALRRLLVIRAEQTQRSRLEQEEMKRKIVEYEAKFRDEERLTDQTELEMFRQYKAMQGELIHRIELLQDSINTLRSDLEQSRQDLEKTKAEKDTVIAERNRKISEQKQKMEDMAIEFGEMLKETLEKMSKRIDTTH